MSRPVVIAVLLLNLWPAGGRAEEFAVPVLLEAPACALERLGPVQAEVGRRVSEQTDGARVPTVRIDRALARLADVAREAGGDAVVLRSRQGIFFTHNGRPSAAPVFIQLRGGALRLPADRSGCTFVPVDARRMQAEMRADQARQAWARDAYGD